MEHGRRNGDTSKVGRKRNSVRFVGALEVRDIVEGSPIDAQLPTELTERCKVERGDEERRLWETGFTQRPVSRRKGTGIV